MRRRIAGAVVLIAGCAPALTQIGRDHYRVECEWFDDCKRQAQRLCPDGYSIEDAKDAHTGSFLVARCKPRPAVAAVQTKPEPEPEPEPQSEALGVECVRDFQCSQPGARCTDGKCVAPPAEVPKADEADPCVVGTLGSAEPTPIFRTEKAAGEFFAARATSSQAATLELVARLEGTWVDPGVRCKTLQVRARARYVQLVSGPAAGREGWLGTPESVQGDAGVR